MRAFLPFFNLLRLPLSRHRAWALETLRVIDATGATTALDGLRTALEAHSARVDGAEQLRDSFRQASGKGTAAAVAASRAAEDVDTTRLINLDAAVDLAIGRLHRKWTADADAFGAGDPIGRAAARLASALFPGGLSAHISVTHTEQYGKNQKLLAALRGGAWDEELALTSSTVLVDRVDAAIRAFQTAWETDVVRRASASVVTFDEVREAELRCHEGMVTFFVDALSLLQSEPELLGQVLAPFGRHQADQRAARRLGARPEDADGLDGSAEAPLGAEDVAAGG
jgi:hypothetical protein